MNLTTIIISLIGLLILFGIIGHIQLSVTLNGWLRQVENLIQFPDRSGVQSPWMQDLIEDYRETASSQQDMNTQALIESHFYKQPIRWLGLFKFPIGNASRLLEHLPSFTIILGVLGTFIGLTESMFSMQKALLTMGGTGSQVTADSILSTIASPFKGMSLAFLTSIAGIGGSLLLNLVQGGFLSKGESISYIVEKLLTTFESLLDHTIQKELLLDKPRDPFEKILDRLATRIGESFQITLGDFSKDMVTFTKELKSSVSSLDALLSDFSEHRQALTQSSENLVTFGEHFHETTEQYKTMNQSISTQIDRLKESVDRVFSRVEQQEKRTEQQTKQVALLLEGGQKQSETLSRQFLQAMEQQMQGFHDKYDNAAESLSRQQEDWLYQHRDMNNQYAQGSETMVHAVEQLERGIIQVAEKLKRDILDQMKYQQERNMQLLTRDQDRGGERDLIRAFDQMGHGLERGFDEQRRYYQEFIQMLSRLSNTIEHQARTASSSGAPYESRALTTRVIDP